MPTAKNASYFDQKKNSTSHINLNSKSEKLVLQRFNKEFTSVMQGIVGQD